MALLYPAGQDFTNTVSISLAGGTLSVYTNKTTTLTTIYDDPELTNAITNPHVLDGSGKPTTNIYVADATRYTVEGKTALGAVAFSRDNTWGSLESAPANTAYDVYNVKNATYGALGDGIADDTAAVQAAIDAAEAAGGGIVFFPEGTYLLTNIYVRNDNIHLKGAGRGATTLKMKDNTSAENNPMVGFGWLLGHTGPTNVNQVSISEMSLNGNRTNQNNGTTANDGSNHAISAVSANNLQVYDVEIYSCDGYGIGLVGSTHPNRINQQVRNVEIRDCKYDGINTKAPDLYGVTFDNIYIHTPAQPTVSGRSNTGLTLAVEYGRVSNCLIRGTDASNQFSIGVWVPGDTAGTNVAGDDIEIVNCEIEWCANGITASGNDGGTIGIANCSIDDCDDGIKVSREATTVMVTNTQVRGGAGTSSGMRIENEFDGVLLCQGCSFIDCDNDGVFVATDADIIQKISFIGCEFARCDRHGLIIQGDVDFVELISCHIKNNDTSEVGGDGLRFTDVTADMIRIIGCDFVDDQGTPTQNSGINWTGSNTVGALRIRDNYFAGNVTSAIAGTIPTPNFISGNVGYVTENSGTGSIADTTTSDVITHGLGITPALADIHITLGENPTNTPGAIWVDTIGSSSFTVNCENDPGASNLDFSWKVTA